MYIVKWREWIDYGKTPVSLTHPSRFKKYAVMSAVNVSLRSNATDVELTRDGKTIARYANGMEVK